MVEEIEDTIQQVTAESTNADQALNSLEQWGDEDLDNALDQKRRFDELARRLSVLNDATIQAFNDDQDDAYGLLPAMRVLYEACSRNLNSLNNSKIAVALRTTIENFQNEVDQLQENIEDFILIHDELPQDNEWQDILSKL